MIFGMSLYEIFAYFMIYSCFGWMTEVAYHAVTQGKIINRGFLNGPVCPVYGCGVLAVFGGLYMFSEAHQMAELNGFLIFLVGSVICTLIEFLAGWILDVLFHARWWDYRSMPFNINGYVCLKFSIAWGIGVLVVVRIIHSAVRHAVTVLVPMSAGIWVLPVLYLIMAADLSVTVSMIIGLNRKLKKINDMQQSLRLLSDHMSEVIGTNAISASQKIKEQEVQAQLAHMEIRDAVEQKGAEIRSENQKQISETKAQIEEMRSLLLNDHSGTERLLRAFPTFRHDLYDEIIRSLRESILKI